MARSKNPFIKNTELQEEILLERRNNHLTIREIGEKYPQYSVVTYTRFLRRNFTIQESAEIELKARDRLKDNFSTAQIESWKNRDQSKKDKHISHLRDLALGQRGKTPGISEIGKTNQIKNGVRQGNSPQNKANMAFYAKSHIKYDRKDLMKIIEDSGATVVGKLPDLAGDYVLLKWGDGKTRRCMVKRFLKLGYIPKPCLSIGESEIFDYIVSLGFSPKKKRIDKREIDILIEEKSFGIEFNGLFWHCEENKEKYYHRDKTDFFKENGIKIVHIWEHEWWQNKEQVKNFIRSKLGVNKTLYARKCDFREITKEEAKSFCLLNHIQGYPYQSKLSLGCFYENELVGVSVFGNHHRNGKEHILSRLCFNQDINVVGALSKFSKMGTQLLGTDIFTWCDLRLSDGSSYEKAGWNIVSKLPVDYFYWTGKLDVVSKQSRKKTDKEKLSGLTEKEQAEIDGLSRIWDCGKIKLIFRKT